jgi:hypothetical protein
VSDPRQNDSPVRCEEMEFLAVLHACDELEADSRAAVDAHVAGCPACASILAREDQLHQAVVSLDHPADSLDRSGLLLAQCRSELAEVLDDQRSGANRSVWFAALSPATWWTGLRNTLIYHPAMSMAVLVVAGFLAGVEGQRLRIPPPSFLPPPVAALSSTPPPQQSAPTWNNSNVASSSSRPRITDEQLRSADNAHVAWVTPDGSRTPAVRVELNAPTPMEIVGAPDDTEIQRALTFFLENSQRFDPSTRLDSLDVLRTRTADPGVRRTLCAAARLDRDSDVRIRALEALQGFEQDPSVRETLLGALQSDNHSGVRLAALNLVIGTLRAENGLGAPDPQILDALRDRAHNDPNRSIRQQSAALLRELGAQ